MNKPNILFLFPDQHRKEWFPYKEEVFEQWQMKKPQLNMPNIEKLMGKGVTFLNTITPSPLCAPARACVASGVRYDNCETFNNAYDFPFEKENMYKALRDTGYNVYGVGKFDLRKKTCDWFNKENYDKFGFTKAIDNEGKIDGVNHATKFGEPKGPYLKYLDENGLMPLYLKDMIGRKNKTNASDLPDEAYGDNWITRNAMELISSTDNKNPWFMQVNFTGPHSPFDITKSMKESVKDREFEKPFEDDGKSENINEIRQNYAAMIENIDRNIGELLSFLEKRGELDNTVIVYSSDHGEMLGDFGRFSKSVPFRGSVNIPLVVVTPNAKRAGEYDSSIVELQDLTSTFLELAGIDKFDASGSKSLMPILNKEVKTHREYAFSALKTNDEHGFRMVCDKEFKYIEYINAESALYDIVNDVWESNNIVDDLPYVAIKYNTLLKELG